MKSAENDYKLFIEPMKDHMKRSIVRIVQNPDDAADAFQDALFRVWTYWDRIAVHPNPNGYISSICISSAYDLLRKKARNYKLELSMQSEFVPIHEKPTPAIVKEEIMRSIHQAIMNLPVKQAQAVFLRLFEEESYMAISKVLDCKEDTVRSHVSKGIASLRQVLSDQNISLAEV